MRKLYVMAFALAVLAGCASAPVSSGAQAKIGSGQWLHDLWGAYQRVGAHTETVVDDGLMLQYIGFVEGAAGTMGDAEWLDLASTTYGQQFAVVGKYLDDHPERCWQQLRRTPAFGGDSTGDAYNV
jgi:hypothetical protein